MKPFQIWGYLYRKEFNVVFSRQNQEIHVNDSFTVRVLGGIFHVMAENWKHLKDTLAFSSFLVC